MGIYWAEDNQNEADDVNIVFVKKSHKHNIKSFICSNGWFIEYLLEKDNLSI